MKAKSGRCINITSSFVTILSVSGISKHSFLPSTESLSVKIGDLVEIKDQQVKLLTKQLSAKMKLSERILHPRRRKAMKVRSLVENAVREFFTKGDFIEVRTPLLVKSPGMEAHIDPFQLSTGAFLPSSPEFAMKKLLVGGLEKIFQICSAFRNEPFSASHRPEFTMLEFYRAYSTDQAIQRDFEQLVEFLALKINGNTFIHYQGQKIDVSLPWPRLRIDELFQQHLNVDLKVENTPEKLKLRAQQLNLHTAADDTWDDVYFRLWLDQIENKLPQDRAAFVTHYPASQAALANLEQNTRGTWAKRFEAYLGGLELCNGFDELTNATEQRKRFAAELDLRRQLVKDTSLPISPIDEEFLAALEEGMPPSGGVAVGLDRLIMLFADEDDIEYCFWLNPYIAVT